MMDLHTYVIQKAYLRASVYSTTKCCKLNFNLAVARMLTRARNESEPFVKKRGAKHNEFLCSAGKAPSL